MHAKYATSYYNCEFNTKVNVCAHFLCQKARWPAAKLPWPHRFYFLWDRVSCILGWLQIHYGANIDLELLIILSPSPEYWNYRCSLSCLVCVILRLSTPPTELYPKSPNTRSKSLYSLPISNLTQLYKHREKLRKLYQTVNICHFSEKAFKEIRTDSTLYVLLIQN